MKKKHVIAILLPLLCSCGTGGSVFQGTASIVMGASTGTSSLMLASALIADGNWLLSPDQAKITFTAIDFVDSAGKATSSELQDCTVTYDRSKKSGTPLSNCMIKVPAGTYVGLVITYNPTFEILINDSVNGLYTDPDSATKLSTTPPTGGAAFVPYTIASGGGSSSAVYFPAPVEINKSPEITIVTDMIHTIMASVSGGTASFQSNSGQRPVELVATTQGEGRSEFYGSSASIGNISGSETYVRVFYSKDLPVAVLTNGFINNCHDGNTPSGAWSANPATAPSQGNGLKAGGYLGLDANGVLAWAFPTSFTWSSYTGLYELVRKTTVGSATTLQCQSLSNAPAPSSGDTYSSGAPAITPSNNVALTLLAN